MKKIFDFIQVENNKQDGQYSLAIILTIWFLSALPMAIMAFVVTPALIPKIKLHPGIVYWLSIIVGMVWQFLLSVIILSTEGYKLNWKTIQQRMRYETPKHPKTGRPNKKLLLWVIPFIALSGIFQIIKVPDLEGMLFPFIKDLPMYDMSDLATPEYKGAWWILGILLVSMLFNYFFGEEFLYRGILLPKMKGVFGKWDWFANGVLFGFYHLHKPHMVIRSALLTGILFAFPSAYFRSSWMAFIIHGIEGLFILVLVLGILFGLT